MPLGDGTKEFITELRALLLKHNAVIMANMMRTSGPMFDDTATIEIVVNNQTVLYPDKLDSSTTGKYINIDEALDEFSL